MAFVIFNLLCVAALVGLDQAIKFWAVSALQPIGAMPLIPHVVELRFVLNPGMAFSLLSGKQLFLDHRYQHSADLCGLRAVLPQPRQIPAAGRTAVDPCRRHRQPDRPYAQRRGGGLHELPVHAISRCSILRISASVSAWACWSSACCWICAANKKQNSSPRRRVRPRWNSVN